MSGPQKDPHWGDTLEAQRWVLRALEAIVPGLREQDASNSLTHESFYFLVEPFLNIAQCSPEQKEWLKNSSAHQPQQPIPGGDDNLAASYNAALVLGSQAANDLMSIREALDNKREKSELDRMEVTVDGLREDNIVDVETTVNGLRENGIVDVEAPVNGPYENDIAAFDHAVRQTDSVIDQGSTIQLQQESASSCFPSGKGTHVAEEQVSQSRAELCGLKLTLDLVQRHQPPTATSRL